MIDIWDIPTTEEVEREITACNMDSLMSRFKRITLNWATSEFDNLIHLKFAGSAYNFIDYTLPFYVNIGVFDRNQGEIIEIQAWVGLFTAMLRDGYVFEITEDNRGQIDELVALLKQLCEYYKKHPDDIPSSDYDYILPIRHWLCHQLTSDEHQDSDLKSYVDISQIEAIYNLSKEGIIKMVEFSSNMPFELSSDLTKFYLKH